MLTFVVAVVTADTVVAPDSSSLFELLLAPDMLSMADVAAVNGCSKNLSQEKKWEEKDIEMMMGQSEFYISIRK